MRELLRRARYFLRRRRFEDELEEELAFHREMTRQGLEDDGISAERVAAETQRALGNDALGRDHARDVWIWPWLQDISQDLRFATRILAKDRRFTLAAVVALGLGIGVTNTVFTIVNTASFRDLPFPEPDRLISIQTQTTRGQGQATSLIEYNDWRNATTTFAGIAATAMAPMNLVDEGRPPERLRGTFVSANTFRLLRVTPTLGRDFLPEDDRPGAPAVVIISYGVWQTLYAGDAATIGRHVRVNEVPSTIVGVMPPRFGFPGLQDLWQPLAVMPGLDPTRRDARRLGVFGRLADTAELPRARAEIETVVAQLAKEYPDTNKDTIASVVRMRDRLPNAWPVLSTMMAAVGSVLLIACANVANLLLARSLNRVREIAIRASLGATRWRIVRQLLIECVVVAFFAGGLGLVLSRYGVSLLGVAFDLLDAAGPGQSNTPYWVDLSMNWTVFVFVAVLCVATGLAFGIVPALQISKTDVNETLKDGGRGGSGGRHARRWTSAFVIAELALTLMLSSAAGLLWRNLLTAYRSDAIIDAPDLVTMRLSVPGEKYATAERAHLFYRQLDERLAGRSDTFRAAIGSYVPYALPQGPLVMPTRQVTLEGQAPVADAAPPSVMYALAGPRYFETIGLPTIRGRVLSERDEQPGQEGVIVDQRFVSMLLANEEPLGRRIQISATGPQSTRTSAWLTIVGVVPTLTQFGPGRPANPAVYAPLALEPTPRDVALFVRRPMSVERTSGHDVAIGRDPQLPAIVSAVREEVRALDANLPLFSVETMDATLARTRVSSRLFGQWFGMLAAIALVLASVGLYALTAHSVAIRTQEIGVRMALGAQTTEVVWLFLRRSIVQLAIGLMLGLSGALAAGQVLQGTLTRISPRDAMTLAVASVVLITVSIVASLIPARRAARLDPMIALRQE